MFFPAAAVTVSGEKQMPLGYNVFHFKAAIKP